MNSAIIGHEFFKGRNFELMEITLAGGEIWQSKDLDKIRCERTGATGRWMVFKGQTLLVAFDAPSVRVSEGILNLVINQIRAG